MKSVKVKTEEKTRTISAFLVIKENGAVRVSKKKPSLDGDEIAFVLDVVLPSNIFDFNYPNIKLTVDDASILHAPYEARAKRLLDKV